jgi:hypothetical protein
MKLKLRVLKPNDFLCTETQGTMSKCRCGTDQTHYSIIDENASNGSTSTVISAKVNSGTPSNKRKWVTHRFEHSVAVSAIQTTAFHAAVFPSQKRASRCVSWRSRRVSGGQIQDRRVFVVSREAPSTVGQEISEGDHGGPGHRHAHADGP